MLSLLQFNIGMLQLFNICLFPSCSCVILAGKKFSPYFARFAASLCQSHTGQVVILLWIFWSGPVKYESHQTVTVNYAPGDFCHHCDFEEWKPGRYESQRQWNFVSRKLGGRPFIFVYRQHCWSCSFMELVASQSQYCFTILLNALLLTLSQKRVYFHLDDNR